MPNVKLNIRPDGKANIDGKFRSNGKVSSHCNVNSYAMLTVRANCQG